LRALAHERGLPLRTVINDALRAGTRPQHERERYVPPTYPLGIRPGVDIDKALELAAADEDREIAHKLELRK
jgi:hypothetical protein